MKATMTLLSLFFAISFCLPGPTYEVRTKQASISENPFKDSLEREDMHCRFSNNFDFLFLSKPGKEPRKIDSIVYNKIKNQRFGSPGVLSLMEENTIFACKEYIITALWSTDTVGKSQYWFIDWASNKSKVYSKPNNVALLVKN